MDMQEFYKFHGITRRQFAKMVGVNPTSLMHFEAGHDVSFEARLRIEIGIEIMEDCKIIYQDNPKHLWMVDAENEKETEKFDKTFKRVILIEL